MQAPYQRQGSRGERIILRLLAISVSVVEPHRPRNGWTGKTIAVYPIGEEEAEG